jgi:serine protease inhibitor
MTTTSTGGGLTEQSVRAANGLTARWAAALADEQTDAKGTAFSGIGVWPLLGLLSAGADEQGRTELGSAFGLDADAASDAVRHVVDLFDRNGGLSLAMGLWQRSDVTIRKDWLDLLPPATRGVLSGDARADQAALDAWVREHTKGRLDRMPVLLTPSIVLLLASALTVDTKWNVPLKPSSGPGVGAWANVTLPLLSRETLPSDTWLVRTPGGPLTVTVLEGSDEIDVYLLLGEDGRGAASVLGDGLAALDSVRENGIPATAWSDGQDAPGRSVTTTWNTTGRAETWLECVAFELSAQHDLLKNANVFGLEHVAANAGGLPGISDTPVRVGEARQDVVAEFSAEGFKAAAVTVVSAMRAAFARPTQEARRTTISYTRPHAFAAVHRASGLILVAGWVGQAGSSN